MSTTTVSTPTHGTSTHGTSTHGTATAPVGQRPGTGLMDRVRGAVVARSDRRALHKAMHRASPNEYNDLVAQSRRL